LNKKFLLPAANKSSIGLLVLALIVGGISAQATGILNTASGGYLVCVNSTTKVVTHPGTSSCPKGSKKLILGAQGVAGATGLSGKDGATLWNGIKDPESTVGAPGDMFINATTKVLFGPKDVVTGWPAGVSMVGPQGSSGSGSVGPTGAAGAPGSNATLTCAQGGTCVVGNTGPGGGIVFYVQTATADAPWRYMEAAPNTWAGGSADPAMNWCTIDSIFLPLFPGGGNPTDLATASTFTTIGSGFRNTKVMLANCTWGAANAVTFYNGGGKNDWFLPSKGELDELYAQRVIVGGFIPDNPPTRSPYHSSSEGSATEDLLKLFATGADGNGTKSSSYYIRPVRAF